MIFRNAIVRKPPSNFAAGLTTSTLGSPDLALTLAQHDQYCRALEACGLALTVLPADPGYPDSPFVEDTAVLVPGCAILTRPGAPSRQGEVEAIRPTIEGFFDQIEAIQAPGTLEGGDICEAGKHFFIGVSHRTNEAGASQLAEILARHGYSSAFVDIRGVNDILHLKSGIAALDENTLVLIDSLYDHPAFTGYRRLRVAEAENYAANCVRINDLVILPSGFPGLQTTLEQCGFAPMPLDVSEYRKMDGGLSCLSLRF